MSVFSIHKSPLFLRMVFVIAIFIMIFVTALTYRHVDQLTLSSKSVAHTYKATVEIEQLYTNIKDLEIERRNYLLVNNKNLIQNIANLKVEISKNLIRIEAIIKENPKQILLLKKLDGLVNEKFKVIKIRKRVFPFTPFISPIKCKYILELKN